MYMLNRFPKILSLLATLFIALYASAEGARTPFEESSSNALEQPAASSFSSALEELSSEEEFLTVDEAYQLEVMTKGDQIALSWVIADEYFLYGEQFRASANGQDLALNIPTGKVQYDPIFEKDVEKHYRYVEVTFDKSQMPAVQPLELAVTSQGCADAGLCYPPHTLTFSVNADHSEIKPILQNTSFDAGTGINTPAPASVPQQAPLVSIALTMVAFALLGGLILNLMPCVLPVLSLKALSLAANHDHQTQKRHGWSYTLGVVSTFVLVAIVLLIVRSAGQAVGWGFQLQTPWFVTLLVYLFFVMGLALSGYIHLGSRWMNTGQNLTEGHGFKQSYFTGVLAAVVASPCTAPFMASALGYAIAQPWWLALSIFVALGFGMALPFLLLSYSPQLSRFLPQPGPWMDTFKQALAFPLYLTAIWLLWLLGRQLGTDAMVMVIMGGLAITFIYWLSHRSIKVQSLSSALVIALAVAFSWYSSQQPTITKTQAVASVWEPYSEQRLAELRADGKAVFINATADWCITCKANEKFVFTEAMLEKMKNKEIYLLMADWTNYDPAITSLLEKYRRGGVPLYILFPRDTDAREQVLPQILTPSGFGALVEAI